MRRVYKKAVTKNKAETQRVTRRCYGNDMRHIRHLATKSVYSVVACDPSNTNSQMRFRPTWSLLVASRCPHENGLVRSIIAEFIVRRSFNTSKALLKSSSSSSSNRWLQRQTNDYYAREAKARQYASRAAFKLIQLNKQYKLFKPGMTVVDLGFAPGSWSQIAVEHTQPLGRVIGVDILYHQPPKGASAIQGNFLSKGVQDKLKMMLRVPELGRPFKNPLNDGPESQQEVPLGEELSTEEPQLSYIDRDRYAIERELEGVKPEEIDSSPCVDIVLSDMCDPWPQSNGFWTRSINDPYLRMANTSGLAVKDHGASIVGFKIC